MKKIFTALFLITILATPVMAKTIKVEALSDFSTVTPPLKMEVKAVTDLQIDTQNVILPNYLLKGEIVNIKDPTRLKRDATFGFLLTSYVDKAGKEHHLKEPVAGKYTTNFDVSGMAKSAALGVGDHFFKGISAGFTAIEGVVKNEEDNRLKSGAVALYKSSPLSYVEMGHPVVIPKNQIFILNFKIKGEEEEQLPNYNFTPVQNPAINTVDTHSISLPAENPSETF